MKTEEFKETGKIWRYLRRTGIGAIGLLAVGAVYQSVAHTIDYS